MLISIDLFPNYLAMNSLGVGLIFPSMITNSLIFFIFSLHPSAGKVT